MFLTISYKRPLCSILYSSVLGFSAFSVYGAELREWTDVSGQHSVQAELVGVRNANAGRVAILKKADGTTVTVPFVKLSERSRKQALLLSGEAAGNAAQRKNDSDSHVESPLANSRGLTKVGRGGVSPPKPAGGLVTDKAVTQPKASVETGRQVPMTAEEYIASFAPEVVHGWSKEEYYKHYPTAKLGQWSKLEDGEDQLVWGPNNYSRCVLFMKDRVMWSRSRLLVPSKAIADAQALGPKTVLGEPAANNIQRLPGYETAESYHLWSHEPYSVSTAVLMAQTLGGDIVYQVELGASNIAAIRDFVETLKP